MTSPNGVNDASVLLAATTDQAARVAGVSPREVRAWEGGDIVTPGIISGEVDPAVGSLYAFRDLVALSLIARLARHGISVDTLKRVGTWLRERADRPWSALEVMATTDALFMRDDGTVTRLPLDPPAKAEATFKLADIAEEVGAAARRLTERAPEQIGVIVRDRRVLRNAPILAGTRIPTRVVWDFHVAGYDTEAILREYPRLTPIDVERAIDFERQRQLRRAG